MDKIGSMGVISISKVKLNKKGADNIPAPFNTFILLNLKVHFTQRHKEKIKGAKKYFILNNFAAF